MIFFRFRENTTQNEQLINFYQRKAKKKKKKKKKKKPIDSIGFHDVGGLGNFVVCLVSGGRDEMTLMMMIMMMMMMTTSGNTTLSLVNVVARASPAAILFCPQLRDQLLGDLLLTISIFAPTRLG